MQTFKDVVHHRFILTTLVGKELKTMYRSMALGFLWSLLNPLVMVAVLSVVLVWFLGRGDERSHYAPALVVVGLIPYNFFSYCVNGCASAIVSNASLVKKVRFPRQILPFSVVLTHLVHFAIQSLLVIGVLAVFPTEGEVLGLQLLWLVPVFVVHLGLCTGVGLLVAGLTVLYRDTRYMVDSALMVLFWLSPVLYSGTVVAQKAPDWAWYLYFANPLSGILESYRSILFFGVAPEPTMLLLALGATLLVGAVGVRTFWIHENQFADLI